MCIKLGLSKSNCNQIITVLSNLKKTEEGKQPLCNLGQSYQPDVVML